MTTLIRITTNLIGAIGFLMGYLEFPCLRWFCLLGFSVCLASIYMHLRMAVSLRRKR